MRYLKNNFAADFLVGSGSYPRHERLCYCLHEPNLPAIKNKFLYFGEIRRLIVTIVLFRVSRITATEQRSVVIAARRVSLDFAIS